MNIRGSLRLALGLVFSLVVAIQSSLAEDKKTFVAFSMRVAQARVEAALKAGEDFRNKQPDLYHLGGITKPWAIVLDTKTGDWILVGEQAPDSSALTLDDWVDALKARFVYPDKDPGVTINPKPCEPCQKAGRPEACRHYTRQEVVFFGGIEDTHFGQVCFDSDWLMKRIGLALEKLPAPWVKTYYEVSVEEAQSRRGTTSSAASRFWFYPIVNRVNVLYEDGIVLLEKFQMGVFTEVLYAEVDGKPVEDVDRFEHYPSEAFSRSFSENYDAVAEVYEVLDTLRGLTRLAALAKGLTQMDRKPDVGFFLKGYPNEAVNTPDEVEVFKVTNQEVLLEISGGVSLSALAMRLRGGDVTALRQVVLEGRPSQETLRWTFVFTGDDIELPPPPPDSVAELWSHGEFLFQQHRYDLAIACWRQLARAYPDVSEIYYRIGLSFERKGMPSCAADYYSKGLALDPFLKHVRGWTNTPDKHKTMRRD